MNLKRILIFVIIFSLGLGLGVALTYHPSPPIPPALYKSEAYFSPNGNVASNLIKAINNSTSSIDLAIFDLTSQDIVEALVKAKERGVKIKIIADSRQAGGKHSLIYSLRSQGFNIKITHGIKRGIMHNKFAILDNKLLITGSYNWTYSAEHFNYENAVFISDPNIIKS